VLIVVHVCVCVHGRVLAVCYLSEGWAVSGRVLTVSGRAYLYGLRYWITNVPYCVHTRTIVYTRALFRTPICPTPGG